MRYALLQLERYIFRHKLRVNIGILDILDIYDNFLPCDRMELFFKFFYFGPAAADYYARPRGEYKDPHLVAGALHLYLRDCGGGERLLYIFTDLHIFQEHLGELSLFGEPP